jgi:hypothetical protein
MSRIPFIFFNGEVANLGLRHFPLKIQTIICLTDGQKARVISRCRASFIGSARGRRHETTGMTTYHLLKDTAFEPEAIEAMGRAYADLLADLKLADRNDAFTEILAKEIVKTASRGVRSATDIRANVLATLGKSAGV